MIQFENKQFFACDCGGNCGCGEHCGENCPCGGHCDDDQDESTGE